MKFIDCPGVILKGVGNRADFTPRGADRLATVARFDLRQYFGFFADEVGDALENLSPFPAAHLLPDPLGKTRVCRFNGAVNIVGGRLGDLRQHLPGSRFVNRGSFTIGTGDALAANCQPFDRYLLFSHLSTSLRCHVGGGDATIDQKFRPGHKR
jgi:hypothetical protein